jgi:hypothetical protein
MPQTVSPPNIIVILVDDMGFSDLGCYGSEIQTPALSRLAENGMGSFFDPVMLMDNEGFIRAESPGFYITHAVAEKAIPPQS